MPLIRIDLPPDGHLPAPAAARLDAALAACPDGPVVAMIHGFRFSPRTEALSPHRHILGLDPRPGDRRAVSWPRALGFGTGRADEGLAIALGWEARGTLWGAWRAAARAGTGLAEIAARTGERPLDLMAHSMGARVALRATAAAPADSIGRVVLLAAAEFGRNALRAMSSPAGRRAEFVNVTTRENALFDLALELALGGALWNGLGRGLPGAPPGWTDLDLDCPATRAGLARLGHAIPGPGQRICHWSPYLRPGVFGLYRALLRDRGATGSAHLRAVMPARTMAPRRLATAVLHLPGGGTDRNDGPVGRIA